MAEETISLKASELRRIIRLGHAIAHAANGPEHVDAKLLAQPKDGVIDGPFSRDVVRAPDRVEQVRAAESAPGIGQQQAQQAKLNWRQLDRLAIEHRQMPVRVELEGTIRDRCGPIAVGQERLPQQIVAQIHELQMPPWALLLSINIVLLIMGSFLEPPAAILILTPLLLPLVQAEGVDPIHFGIIMAVNLSIGMYTPPFGLNLFTSQAVFQRPLGTIYRGVLPFLAINFATLMVITYVPKISMVLLGK